MFAGVVLFVNATFTSCAVPNESYIVMVVVPDVVSGSKFPLNDAVVVASGARTRLLTTVVVVPAGTAVLVPSAKVLKLEVVAVPIFTPERFIEIEEPETVIVPVALLAAVPVVIKFPLESKFKVPDAPPADHVHVVVAPVVGVADFVRVTVTEEDVELVGYTVIVGLAVVAAVPSVPMTTLPVLAAAAVAGVVTVFVAVPNTLMGVTSDCVL